MSFKKTLAAVSAGMVLSGGAMAQAQERDDAEMTMKDVQSMYQESRDTEHLERFNTAETGDWITRVPEQGGYRNAPVTSLDEALKNPDLKNHIYLPGIGAYQTPLAYGVINNDLGLVGKCLSAGVNPDIGMIGKAPGPESPLAKAVNSYCRFKKEGRDVSVQKRMVESLLEAGANPNIRTSVSSERDGANTPLHAMAILRDDAMIDLLVKYGADKSAKRGGQTPADIYNTELTGIGGAKLAWRGNKNPETVSKLTPESGFSILNMAFAAKKQNG